MVQNRYTFLNLLFLFSITSVTNHHHNTYAKKLIFLSKPPKLQSIYVSMWFKTVTLFLSLTFTQNYIYVPMWFKKKLKNSSKKGLKLTSSSLTSNKQYHLFQILQTMHNDTKLKSIQETQSNQLL